MQLTICRPWILAVGLSIVILAAGACAASAQTFWAQEQGFRFGAYINGSGIGAEDPTSQAGQEDLYLEESGGGMAFLVGYRFNPLFSLNVALSSARHETTLKEIEAYYGTFMIEGHFHFLPEERVRPYVLAGLGGVGLVVDTDGYKSESRGGGMDLGLGMLWNITDHLLFDAALRLDIIEWDEIEFTRELPGGEEIKLTDPLKEDGGAGRFQLGLTWAL